MSEQVKILADSLKEEFVKANKPLADWRNFLNLVVENYRHQTNCVWGWALLDWLVKNGHIESRCWVSNVAKSFAMDEIIASKKLTLDQIITYINEN